MVLLYCCIRTKGKRLKNEDTIRCRDATSRVPISYGLWSNGAYFTSIWRLTFTSSFFILGRVTVRMPFSTLAAMLSLSTSSGSV